MIRNGSRGATPGLVALWPSLGKELLDEHAGVCSSSDRRLSRARLVSAPSANDARHEDSPITHGILGGAALSQAQTSRKPLSGMLRRLMLPGFAPR